MEKPFTIPVFIFSILLLSFEFPTFYLLENTESQGFVVENMLPPPVEVQAVVTGSLPQVEVGYCQLGQTTVTFTNMGMSGDPAQSTINDLSLGITLGGAFQLTDGAFEITGIRIAGVDLDNFNPNNPLNGNALFSTDPDGANGLSDEDGDGFFDDLKMGRSVEITAFYRLDCDETNSTIGNCFNDLETSLNARMAYFEQGELNSVSLLDYFSPTHRNISFGGTSTPDAFLGIDTFQISHQQIRLVKDFDTDCSSDGKIEIQMALPIGVTPIMDEITFSHNGEELPIFSSITSAGLLVLNYEAGQLENLNGEFSLDLTFFADCTVNAGPSSFPLTMRHYCPSCDCSHIWFCGALNGPQLHASSPPCPPSSIPSCDKGIRTMAFEVDRTTFGFEDEALTVPFSPQAANTKVALGCDSVRMHLLSVVGSNPIPDSVGIIITYDNPDGSPSGDETFLFDEGTVRITHLGGEYTCAVSPANLTVNDDAGAKTLTFDLNGCVLGLGFSLTSGDTVEFFGNFAVNEAGPFSDEFSTVPNFRGYAFVQQTGQIIRCDNFGETFWLGKTDATYEFPPLNSTQPMGCEEGVLDFLLEVPDNDYASYFGDEFRAANKVASFAFTFDPLLLQAYDNVEAEARIPGHPVFGDDFFPVRPLSDFPSGNYLAEFDTLSHVHSLNILNGNSFEFRIRLSPNCQAEANSSFGLASQIIFDDRFYAQNIGDGSCVENRTEAGGSLLEYSGAPQLEISSLTMSNDTVQNMPGLWTVELCNASPSATANLTWLAIQNPGDILQDITLTNVTDPADPQAVSLVDFSEGVYGFTPELEAGECIQFEISASLEDCTTVDFSAFSGWNCGPYSQPNWSPAMNAPCEEVGLPLQLVNDLPAPLSIDFQSVTSECDGGGGELVNVSGIISGMEELDADDFTLTFVFDENGNDTIDAGEPVLSELDFTASISPTNPFVFENVFTASPTQVCQILVTINAANTDLCEEVIVSLPAPQISNAGLDAYPCTLDSPTFSTTLGIPSCVGGNYSFNWSAIPPASADDLSSVSIPQPILEVDWSGHLGDTLVYVLETVRTGCGTSNFDTVNIYLPTAAFGFFETDSIILQAPTCQSLVELCLGLSDSELPNVQITNNGLPYPTAALVPCSDTLNAVQLGIGYHGLVVSDTISGCTDSIFVKVQCTQTETIDVDILLHSSDTICFSNDEIIGSVESLENFCEDGSFVEYEIYEDSCLILTGNWVGAEQACVVVCDNIGFCDTTFVNINVLHPLPNGIKDSIVIEQLDEYCFDANLLNIGGPIVSIENLCPSSSGTSVDFSLNDTTYCVQYFGQNLGIDSACVELCDAIGNCDTVNICVSVIPGDVIIDTVFIEVDTNVFCLNETLLPGNILPSTVMDICPENNGDEVQFVIDGTCISYFGDIVGTDTACIRFEDEFGNVGLINLQVTVVRTIPETICDSVFIGQVKTICLDTSELPGNVSYVEEICPDERSGNVDIFIEPFTFCIDYEGLAEGTDSACLVVCDDFGFCDTTYLCLTIPEFLDLPTLGNDTTSTEKGTPVVIDFLENDTLFGGVTDVFILNPPISGTAVLNLQNSFTYTPEEPFCARWDNFTYVACNPNGCDTATVSIFIECIELTVFSAVSPNNDGVNDFFFVAKIEDFPDNYLWVYNRWGNVVFEKKSYKNNWPGTWGEDVELPDGTYFYILEWSDGGVETVQRGYFEMFR